MKHFATALLGFGIMLAALPAARAADTTCPPSPPPGSTVNGNLIVPPGQSCGLAGVTVTGNVQVQTNSFLEAAFANIASKLIASKVEGNVTLGAGAVLDFSGVGTDPATTARIGGNITGDHCLDVTLGSDNGFGGGRTRMPSLAAMSSFSIAQTEYKPLM